MNSFLRETTFAESFSTQNKAKLPDLEDMKRRIIKTTDELKRVLEYFNDFHDGFLKSIKIMSENKFTQHLPWEKPEQYESNEEKLLDTHLHISDKKGLFIEIHHHNYDWPNKPPDNRIILYLKNVKNVDPTIVRMIGESIIECKTVNRESELGLIFIFETFANSKYDRIELEPLEFEKISIQEDG